MQLFLIAIVWTQEYVSSFVLKNVLMMLHCQNEVLHQSGYKQKQAYFSFDFQINH